MSDLRPAPSLDELVADPAKAAELPAATVETLMVKHATVGSILLARLLATKSNGKSVREDNGDRFLGPADVAAKIGKRRSWVEKQSWRGHPPRSRT